MALPVVTTNPTNSIPRPDSHFCASGRSAASSALLAGGQTELVSFEVRLDTRYDFTDSVRRHQVHAMVGNRTMPGPTQPCR